MIWNYMEQTKYDVFISYSRKDYVDQQGNVIPGNIISQIKDAFQNSGIQYWFDEEGIYSGDKYMEKLADAIFSSTAFVFVSSMNSNASEWTAGEIGTAHLYKKKIIPFRLDDSPFARSIIVKIAHLDYIDCGPNPQKAIEDLVCSVLAAKEEEDKKQCEEEERRRKELIKERRSEVQQEIQNLASDLRRVSSQQQNIIDQIIEQKSILDETDKTCPVCQKKAQLSQRYCDRCGFDYPLLYGLANAEIDTVHLAILRGVWKEVELQQNRKQKLEEANNLLSVTEQKMKESYQELQVKEHECTELSKQLSDNKAKLERLRSEVVSYQTEIANYRKEVAALKKKIKELNTKQTKVENTIVNKAERDYNQQGRVGMSNGDEVFSARANVFSFIKSFCNNKNIKESSTMISAKVKYRKLSEALKEIYHVELSEFALQSFSTIGDLVDTIWQEVVYQV